MSDSTKRTVRTFVQFVVSAAAVLPAVVLLLPPGDRRVAAALAAVVVVATTITKVWNLLEDRGVIPPWLKPDTGRLHEAAYAAAWERGHRAALDEQLDPDVTQVRPVLDSRRAALDAEPGKHSPERTGQPPTSVRARQTGAWSAAAPVRRPRDEGPHAGDIERPTGVG